MHALSCFKPKEIFNINSDSNFIQKKVKDPANSDSDSDDDEQEIVDLLKGDEMKLPKENPGIVRLDVKRFNENKPVQQNMKTLRGFIQQSMQISQSNTVSQKQRAEQKKMQKFAKREARVFNDSQYTKDILEKHEYVKKPNDNKST